MPNCDFAIAEPALEISQKFCATILRSSTASDFGPRGVGHQAIALKDSCLPLALVLMSPSLRGGHHDRPANAESWTVCESRRADSNGLRQMP